MIFTDRTGTNLNRKRIKIISQTPTEILADIERADTVTQEGTKLDASVFNTFQSSINQALEVSNNALTQSSSALSSANQATTTVGSLLTDVATANTNATNALTTANTTSANLSAAVTRIQTLENTKPTFTLSGTTLNITTN